VSSRKEVVQRKRWVIFAYFAAFRVTWRRMTSCRGSVRRRTSCK
jgi:hypothetical protein